MYSSNILTFFLIYEAQQIFQKIFHRNSFMKRFISKLVTSFYFNRYHWIKTNLLYEEEQDTREFQHSEKVSNLKSKKCLENLVVIMKMKIVK